MAEERKKRRGRRAYLEDYKALGNGQIVYTDKMRVYTGSQPWKKALTVLWLWAGLLGVCLVVCGLLPVSGMLNSGYVLLPWVLAFVWAGSVIWALCRMTHHGEELKEHVFAATVQALPVRTVFTAVCCAVSMLGQAVKLLLDGLGNSPAADFSFLVLMALAAVSAAALWLRVRKLPFELRP